MIADLRTAFAFLTILPVGSPAKTRIRPGRAFAYFPLVGLALGILLSLVASVARDYPANIGAFLVLLAWVALTGGLHLDGFGDSCDGLLAAVSPESRLEIMKDPRAGAWSVIGLFLLLLGKFIAIGGSSPLLLIMPPVMGRWVMTIAAYGFPYARASGMGRYFREGLSGLQVTIASLTMLIIMAGLSAFVDRRILILPAVALALTGVVATWASERLGGGLTGDVYGALCELTELACLLTLSSVV